MRAFWRSFCTFRSLRIGPPSPTSWRAVGVQTGDRPVPREGSVEVAGRECFLQFLQGPVTGLGQQLLEEGDRDQSEDDEDQEGSLDVDGVDHYREGERDDRVGHPQAEHAHTHPEAAHVQRSGNNSESTTHTGTFRASCIAKTKLT